MQLDLLATPDPAMQSLLALIAGDPCHQRDREAIVEAIRDSVRPDGTVSANDYRPNIPPYVYPALIGATVNALIHAGALQPTTTYEASLDTKSRNGNKFCRLYRWTATP